MCDCTGQRLNREKDEAVRQREIDRKLREAEAKAVIDEQLKQKAIDKLKRKQCGCVPIRLRHCHASCCSRAVLCCAVLQG